MEPHVGQAGTKLGRRGPARRKMAWRRLDGTVRTEVRAEGAFGAVAAAAFRAALAARTMPSLRDRKADEIFAIEVERNKSERAFPPLRPRMPSGGILQGVGGGTARTRKGDVARNVGLTSGHHTAAASGQVDRDCCRDEQWKLLELTFQRSWRQIVALAGSLLHWLTCASIGGNNALLCKKVGGAQHYDDSYLDGETAIPSLLSGQRRRTNGPENEPVHGSDPPCEEELVAISILCLQSASCAARRLAGVCDSRSSARVDRRLRQGTR